MPQGRASRYSRTRPALMLFSPNFQGCVYVSEVPTLVNTAWTLVLRAGRMIRHAAATKPSSRAYSTKSCPSSSLMKFLKYVIVLNLFLVSSASFFGNNHNHGRKTTIAWAPQGEERKQNEQTNPNAWRRHGCRGLKLCADSAYPSLPHSGNDHASRFQCLKFHVPRMLQEASMLTLVGIIKN